MALESLLADLLANKCKLKKLKDSSDASLAEALSDAGVHSAELINLLEEILINAREHGKHQVEVFAETSGDNFVFVVSDKGPGIHETLPRNIRLSDTRGKRAAALIRLALEEGITGTGTLGRGVGLFLASSYVANHQGQLWICSDGGLMAQEGKLFKEKEQAPSITGTLVLLKVRIR